MKITKTKKAWDYLIVILFVITSGSIFWTHLFGHALTYSIFLFFGIISYFNNEKVGKTGNMVFILLIIILCVISFCVNNSSYKDNSTFGYIICLIATSMVISKYDFYYFRHLITNVVFIICLMGIPIFVMSEMGILSYTIRSIGASKNEYSMYGIYTLGWPLLFHRFSGIWHEPGACQIILNTIIWMHFDNIINWEWGKRLKYKLLTILIASLLTLSTGGYICLMLLLIAVAINIRLKSNNIIFCSFLFIFLTISLILLFNSDVIQNKLFDVREESISKAMRTADALALWRMTLDEPVVGYGLGSVDFWNKSEIYGNTACSSGVLTYMASLGFTWLFLYLFFLKRNIRNIVVTKSSYFLILAILIMQSNEKFIEYPISNIFVFQFFSYMKNSRFYYG